MTRAEVEDKVRDIVVELLRVPAENVTDDAQFDVDLGADTLDLVEVMVEVEDRMCVVIPESDSEGLTTFGKLVDYVAKQLI